MNNNSILKPYWEVTAADYHAFDDYKEAYKLSGIKAKFEEIGCDGFYHAVFWVGKKPTEFIRIRKKEFDNPMS